LDERVTRGRECIGIITAPYWELLNSFSCS
jgi:hypothetical protein